MTHQELGVTISEELRFAADLFGYHIYTRTEHTFIRRDDMPQLLRAFGLWLERDNPEHVDSVRDICESIGCALNTDPNGGALDE